MTLGGHVAGSGRADAQPDRVAEPLLQDFLQATQPGRGANPLDNLRLVLIGHAKVHPHFLCAAGSGACPDMVDEVGSGGNRRLARAQGDLQRVLAGAQSHLG